MNCFVIIGMQSFGLQTTINPLRIGLFIDTSINMKIPKIKWLLFLNPFDLHDIILVTSER